MKPTVAVALLPLFLAAACATPPSATPPATPEPDAKLALEAKSLALGIGYIWGSGTLDYGGKTYPVSAHGFLVLALGFTSVTASGEVYNLKSLSDFDGQYDATRGGS